MVNKFEFNPFTNNLDYVKVGEVLVGSLPSNPIQGQMVLNTLNNNLYIYYDGWQLLHSFSTSQLLLLENGDSILLENGDRILKG